MFGKDSIVTIFRVKGLVCFWLIHYGKCVLCRVQTALPSVKNRARQRIALGKEFYAECRALDKKGHSAKGFFAECQALGKSAALGIGCPA